MSDPTQPSKTPNHALSSRACPRSLADVDLFAEGAQEHWYEAYSILHAECPVVRLEGEGQTKDQDGYILTKYEDIARVVKDPERFPPPPPRGHRSDSGSGKKRQHGASCQRHACLLYTSPSPRDGLLSRMPSSA